MAVVMKLRSVRKDSPTRSRFMASTLALTGLSGPRMIPRHQVEIIPPCSDPISHNTYPIPPPMYLREKILDNTKRSTNRSE
jgi:hypothetical protein